MNAKLKNGAIVLLTVWATAATFAASRAGDRARDLQAKLSATQVALKVRDDTIALNRRLDDMSLEEVAKVLGREVEQWGFVDGYAADAPWHWVNSELQCYRDLAARREYERREGRTADVWSISCVRKAW